MEWEYKILKEELTFPKPLTLDHERIGIQLNVLGKSGWELVETISLISPLSDLWSTAMPHTSRVYFIFKREIKEH